jgi:hypothetical protein
MEKGENTLGVDVQLFSSTSWSFYLFIRTRNPILDMCNSEFHIERIDTMGRLVHSFSEFWALYMEEFGFWFGFLTKLLDFYYCRYLHFEMSLSANICVVVSKI